ncbi:MAG: hypothetical protein KZQ82_17375 [Candidatus Thiodiazotropha sp. (ex Lucinoma annulata)]|nr:hypothetical protein [Candidatus Thiodiazotropha sp. (ex Lucinoma annulata)]
MKRLRNLITQTLVIFLASTISACAGMYQKPGQNPDSPNPDNSSYTIKFNSESGNLVILNNEGKVIPGKRINFPEEHLPVKAIVNYHTIIEAVGSCLIIVNGYVYNYCLH